MKGGKIAILGAGAGGLVSAKYAIESGLKTTVFEQSSDLGGLWQPNNGPMWEKMRTNLSHFSCRFSDYAWDEKAEIFPNKKQMFQYLNGYAEKFSLRAHINFSSKVTKVEKEQKQWKITWENKEKEQNSEVFDYVIIASGIFSQPNKPTIEGENSFAGTIMHSSDYRDAEFYEDKNVVVVGNSFTGTEIASDIAKTAKSVLHIYRRPTWILSRFLPTSPSALTSDRLPIDLLFYRRSTRKQTEEIIFNSDEQNEMANKYMQSLCNYQQSFNELNYPVSSLPPRVAISDSYLYWVRHGKVRPKKANSFRYQGADILLDDQTVESKPDLVIYCTGYRTNLHFLDDHLLSLIEYDPNDLLQPVILYKSILHPEIEGLGFVGLYRGPYFGVLELQARYLISLFAGYFSLPSNYEINSSLHNEKLIRTYNPRAQFPHGDYVGFIDQYANSIAALPNFPQLQKEKEDLYHLLWSGPLVPEHYLISSPPHQHNEEVREKYRHAVEQINILSQYLKTFQKGAESIVNVFRNLVGQWSFKRTIFDQLSSPNQPIFISGSVLCTMIDANPNQLLYREDGFHFISGNPTPIFREYIYHLYQSDNQIIPNNNEENINNNNSNKNNFNNNNNNNNLNKKNNTCKNNSCDLKKEEEREGGTRIVAYHCQDGIKQHLFYSLEVIEENDLTIIAAGDHPCGDDFYRAKYEFQKDLFSFTLTYNVEGPHKNYSISTLFTKKY